MSGDAGPWDGREHGRTSEVLGRVRRESRVLPKAPPSGARAEDCICKSFTPVPGLNYLPSCPTCGAVVYEAAGEKARHCHFHGGPDA